MCIQHLGHFSPLPPPPPLPPYLHLFLSVQWEYCILWSSFQLSISWLEVRTWNWPEWKYLYHGNQETLQMYCFNLLIIALLIIGGKEGSENIPTMDQLINILVLWAICSLLTLLTSALVAQKWLLTTPKWKAWLCSNNFTCKNRQQARFSHRTMSCRSLARLKMLEHARNAD
jgi:hypothetical protein